MSEFTEWLENEIEARGWNRNELSRRSHTDSGLISRILNEERKPGPDTLTAIAQALKIPPVNVFRIAGLLPPEPDPDPDLDQFLFIIAQLPDRERRTLLVMARALLAEQERDQTNTDPHPVGG